MVNSLQTLESQLAEARLRIAELEDREVELQRAEQVQTALYHIANAATATKDMQEFYATVHEIVGRLMVAKNFYIALWDEVAQMVNIPYIFDEFDAPTGTDELQVPMAQIKQGLTGYVIRTEKPLHISRERQAELARQGEIKIVGTPPVDWLGIPLKTDEGFIGTLVVQSYTENVFYTHLDLTLLNFVGQHIATALERARLQDETRRLLAETKARNAELSIINNIQAGLAAKLDIQAIYDLVGDQIREIFDAQGVIISYYEHATNFIHFPYYFFRGNRINQSAYELGRGLTSHIIQSGHPLLINEHAVARFKELGAVFAPGESEDTAKSWLGVPLTTGGQVEGVIALENYEREEAYSSSDMRLLTTVANSMSIALENARLFDETQRLLRESRQRVVELATVYNISQAINAQLEMDALIELVGQQIRQAFRADIAYLALHNRHTNMIHFPYQYGDAMPSLAFGEGFTSQIIETGQPLLLNQDVTARYAQLDKALVGKEALSYLGVPIVTDQQAIGVISVQSTLEEGRFGETDLNLLNTIAANVGTALRNAQLYQETQQAKDAAEAANQDLSSALETLRTAQAQLVEAEKMASLGGLVAGVAHEINTPVGIGVTAASLLEDKTFAFRQTYQSGQMKRADLEKYLDTATQSSAMILKNLQRAAELIQSFKQVAVDQSSEERREFLVKDYLEEILMSLRPQLKKTQHTITINGDDNLTLDSYPGVFSQIVTNLVMNSLIHAYEGEEAGRLVFEFSQSNNRFIFSFSDDGSGISKENLAKIFDPFFTTKRGQGGSGLGLHIIYNLVTQRLGGTIRCESEVDNGTRFVLELPIS